MTKTPIEWTDFTINPFRFRNLKTGKVGHHCTKISPGCKNCYSGAMQAGPYLSGLTFIEENKPKGEFFLDERALEQVLRRKKPAKIFWCDMTDMFLEDYPDEWIDRCFAVMALTPQHTHQVLTKRAERMRKWVSDPKTPFRIARVIDEFSSAENLGAEEIREVPGYPGYFASSHGLIYSEKRGKRRPMKPDRGEQGHLRVQLHRDEKDNPRGDRMLVHHIVLLTFVGPPPSVEAQGCHGDGNPANNAVSNLSWGTQSKNWDDRKRHGNFKSYAKLTDEQVEEIKKRHSQGESGEAIGRAFEVSATQIRNITSGKQWAVQSPIEWPLNQVWLGVSVEDKQRRDRIDHLRQTPAAVRFLSLEPLLEDLGDLDLRGINWAIIGGESGPNARPFDISWPRKIIWQCRVAGVAPFMKQVGADPREGNANGNCRNLNCTHPDCGYIKLKLDDKKGGDPSEWPEDLRVREFPEVPNGA